MKKDKSLMLPIEVPGAGRLACLPALNRCGPRTNKELMLYASAVGKAAAEGKLSNSHPRSTSHREPFEDLVRVAESDGFIGVDASAEWLAKHLNAEA
jgi:hypothetical protein